MKEYTSLEAKTKFGEVILASQREPVIITKNGKPASVMISHEDYNALACRAADSGEIPDAQHQTIRDLIKLGREQILKGQYTPMRGSLREAMATFNAKKNA